ncbi:uncharacterized protein CLUP02_01529 [Colletotrichum lupini]|uniref:Uncharacterized protein n=1 Tax=Colletotrichum lupini TaxID=145971 RepID=A0A9Q8SCH8_9PEZI|nr:uncharacterized protein CLUP02_01529 [Colletotrichum lupini]UQC74877.1 hypothetical protein CLUP02_01529 [Colletotrichum lupini]
MRFGQVLPPVRICSTVQRARSGGRRRKKGRKKSQATASRDASMCLAFLAFVCGVQRATCLPSLGEAFWRGFQPVACLSFRVPFTKQPLSPIPNHKLDTSLCNGSLLKPAVCAPSFDPQKRPSNIDIRSTGELLLTSKVPAACPAVPAYLYHDRSQKWKEAVPPRFHPAAPFFGFLPAQLTEIWPPILVAICGHWLARYQVGSEYCVEDWSHW